MVSCAETWESSGFKKKKTIYKIDRIHVSSLKGESVGEGLRIALALAFTSWNQYSIFRSVYFKVWPLAEQIDGFFSHLCCCSQKSLITLRTFYFVIIGDCISSRDIELFIQYL